MARTPPDDINRLREYRSSRLYRSLARVLRIYNRRLVDALHKRGFEDFSMAFPQLLSNLDTAGTRIGVLAARAGMTRQGAGQLLREIERCGYIERRTSPDDARATIVVFTPRGRRLLATVFELVEETEQEFAAVLPAGRFKVVREGLRVIADAFDQIGAFGKSDADAV
jgi:DNA-binding MarR family transcriptional regulator